MINIFETLKEGQVITNDFTGYLYEIIKIENNLVSIWRPKHQQTISKKEINENFSFALGYDYENY